MREILFRGKRVDTGEWVYGYLSFFYIDGKDENGFIYTDKAQIYCQEDGKNYDVFSKTVGQYTGKDDKDGVKIFEGSKAKVKADKFWLGYEDVVVYWNSEVLQFKMTINTGQYDEMEFDINGYIEEIIVTGNIHD